MTLDYLTFQEEASELVDPREVQVAIPSVGTVMKDFLRMGYAETHKLILNKYQHIEIVFPEEKDEDDICRAPECPGQGTAKMVTDSFNSELICQKCGVTRALEGVVFEESQLYSQQSSASKHKNYKYNIHCEKWLNQIQAKENRTIPPEVVDQIDLLAKKDYTRNGRLRSMHEMKCSEIRGWLKKAKLTKYNNNAALIRRMVTAKNGSAVIPPQLTPEETHEILCDFSRAMDTYESFDNNKEILAEWGKEKIGNKPYYPYGLMKILIMRLPPGPRLNGLLECVHLQTATTLKKHDAVWKTICAQVPGFKYEPTNRTVLICGGARR